MMAVKPMNDNAAAHVSDMPHEFVVHPYSSYISLGRITAHHAMAVEIGGILADRALHDLDPVALIVVVSVIQGQHHLFS